MKTASRPKVDGRMVMAVAHRLTERDRSILTMIYRHRVFTTDQLAEMYFDNINTAQHRLTTLYQLRLVERFQPLDRRYVSQPYHYVLDQLGAMVVAAEAGQGPRQDALAVREGPRHRAQPAPGPPGRHQRLLQRPAGRRPPPGRLRAVTVVVGAFLRLQLQRDRPARRAGGLGGTRRPGHLLPGVRPLDRDPRSAGEEAQELRGPPDRQRLRLLDPVLLRPPPPGSRRPAGPGRSHRPGGDGGPGADTAAGRGDLGAYWLRRMPDAAGRTGRRAHPPESYQRIEETQENRRRIEQEWRRDDADSYGHS